MCDSDESDRQGLTSEVGFRERNRTNRDKQDSRNWQKLLELQNENIKSLIEALKTPTENVNHVVLPEYNPEKPDSDPHAWCATADLCFGENPPQGGKLIIVLIKALKGTASSWLSQASYPGMTWNQFKTLFTSRFISSETVAATLINLNSDKPKDSESLAAYACRLITCLENRWQKCSIEQIAMSTVLAHVSRFDSRLQRLAFTTEITNRDQLQQELQAFSYLKRKSDPSQDGKQPYDVKRTRFNQSNTIKCFNCGIIGHKQAECRKKLTNVKMSYPTTISNPTSSNRGVPQQTSSMSSPRCFKCGALGHIAVRCPSGAGGSGASVAGGGAAGLAHAQRRVDLCVVAPPTGTLMHEGNEDQVEYIINNLLKFLSNDQGIDVEAKLRKFAFFLVLNADLPILDELVEMEGINLVAWTVPTIPKYLLYEMLFKLHMGKYVYEMISFCSPQLSLQLADALINNFKYLTPSESLDKLKLMCKSFYTLVCRLQFYNLENKVITDILTPALNYFQNCLNYFVNPPNIGKLERLSKDDQYKFKGRSLYVMLQLIAECIEQYTCNQVFTPPDFNEMYLLTFKIDDLTLNTSRGQRRTENILECLDQCNLELLDKCKVLVMDVSVKVFCAWSEFDDNGKSMQQTIGEMCYTLREKLLSLSNIEEHPLIDMLQQISCKPVNVGEIINDTDSDTIVTNITTGNDKESWIRALIHRHNLCQDHTLIEHIISNVNILTSSESYTLYKICHNHLTKSSEKKDKLESLCLKLFEKCDIREKYEILDERFKNNCFYDMQETEEFQSMLTEIFNKLVVALDADISDVLNVFLQNPQKVLNKIFTLSSENSQQTDIMLKVMRLLEKYANHYYQHETEPCLIGVTKAIFESQINSEIEQQNFVHFICSLKKANIISGAKLLLLIVMSQLYKGLLNMDLSSIKVQCLLLSEAYTLDEMLEFRAPMLAMLAQVLEVVRWKINTYTTLAPSALELALKLQTELFSSYNKNIPENELLWLMNKLKTLQPLNFYYYKDIWKKYDSTLLEIVSGMPITTDTNIEEIAPFLSVIFCSSIQTEWCMVWDNLNFYDDENVFDIISNVLRTLTETENQNHTDSSWACLIYCYRNLVYVIRYKFFKEPLNDNQVAAVVHKLSTLTNLIREEGIEDITNVLLPLFGYIAERKADFSIDVATLFHERVKPSKLTDTVKMIFKNGEA